MHTNVKIYVIHKFFMIVVVVIIILIWSASAWDFIKNLIFNFFSQKKYKNQYIVLESWLPIGLQMNRAELRNVWAQTRLVCKQAEPGYFI